MRRLKVTATIVAALAISPACAAAKQKALMTPDQLVAKVVAWAAADGSADLAAATTIADAAKDNVTKPCWVAIQGLLTTIQTLPKADTLPKAHLATDVEILTDILLQLQPGAPTVTACAALANAQGMLVTNFVSGVITGTLAIAKVAPVLPGVLPIPLP